MNVERIYIYSCVCHCNVNLILILSKCLCCCLICDITWSFSPSTDRICVRAQPWEWDVWSFFYSTDFQSTARLHISVVVFDCTASRTYELSEVTHVTPFHTCRFHATVTTNRKNGLTGEQLAAGTDSRSVSTGPSRMFSVPTEGCHVGYSREFVGTVYCT